MNERFNKALMNLSYGLVRLSPEFKIIDKNTAAEDIIGLPRRGSGIRTMTEDNGKSLEALGEKRGKATVVTLRENSRRINALALREDRESILLFFHPMLSVLTRGLSRGIISKIVAFYSENILDILKEASQHKGVSYFKNAGLPDKTFFSDLTVPRNFTVATALKLLTEKLDKVDLKKSLTVVVDRMDDCWAKTVNFTVFEYTVTELISVLGLYGSGEKAVMHIIPESRFLKIIVRDKMNHKISVSDRYFGRIFSEIMKLIDVGSKVTMKDDGDFEINVYIPVKQAEYVLREPLPVTEKEFWSYFDYCMEYYGFGKLLQ